MANLNRVDRKHFLTLLCLCAALLLPGASYGDDEEKGQESTVCAEVKLPKPGLSKIPFQRFEKPTEIKDEADCKKLLGEENAKKILEKHDFDSVVLVAFAWAGSGRDSIEVKVGDTVTFKRLFGRTRDLRRHLRVYAVQKDQKWSVTK